MGTGDFAVPPLKALAACGRNIAAVVSQPDRPRGRGLVPEPTPVKTMAEALGLPVWQPETLKDETAREHYKAVNPDIIVVAAYGKILPEWILDDPPLGAINIHASLLPDYRGAAPIQRAVMNGETKTGVTIIKVAPEVDTGDILVRAEAEIPSDETAGELSARLSLIGADLIVEALELIESGKAEWLPQSAGGSTTEKIDKSEARIDWEADALTLKNLVRGLNPNPGAYFEYAGKRVKLWRAAASPSARKAGPGEIVELVPAGPLVACGEGALILSEVQPAGKAVMSGADFVRGYRPQPGDVLK